ncbi:MAG: arylesterase [Alphaproteobacteria bacterium]
MGALTAGLLAATPATAGEPVREVQAAQDAAVIVALGDSLTAGFGLPAEDSFTTRLEAALRAAGVDARVINAGVSGDTSAGGRSRLDWVLADAPDLVIVELGGNDALRGLDPAMTYANLDDILARMRARGIDVLLAGMLAPPNLGRDYGDAFNAIFPRLAAKHGVALYPFFLDGVAAARDLNQRDGIHPNAEGVEVIVEAITPHVLRALVRSGAGAPGG